MEHEITVAGAWFAPGRANLMGEHTDYNEGDVLPFALAQGVTATASARADGLLVLRSRQVPGEAATVEVDRLAPGQVTGWAAYPSGVAWALREAGHAVAGTTIDIDSDLPVGAGISSSAALECAVALALCARSGLDIPREELALIARRAENEFVGAPTGIIDQYASLLCSGGHAMLLDCGSLRTTQVPFRPAAAGAAALIIDTRVTHALVSGEYAARRAECEAAAWLLGVRRLGSLTDPSAVRSLADPILRRRARHVISDSARARTIAAALLADSPEAGAPQSGVPQPGFLPAGTGPEEGATADGDPEIYRYIGTLLSEGHASLRDDFEVSWLEADVTVETAVAAGAYGAKMIGGGFGGSVLALIPEEAADKVCAVLTETYAARGWTLPQFIQAIPSPPARRIA